jgi:hypothetical protein
MVLWLLLVGTNRQHSMASLATGLARPLQLQLLLLLSAARPAHAWVSTTQARFGTTIATIYNESLGIGEGDKQTSLGYLWNLPGATTDVTGLGGSITWAWDERLCDDLQPRFEENFWGISLVSCASIKASMHRAFDTWAMNSRHVKFTDVSDQCAAAGHPHAIDCPLAEIWVTSLTASEASAHATEPIVSTPRASFTTFFRYTNGVYPRRAFGSGPTAHWVNRKVAEVTGGTLAFRETDDVCWYLDSQFCSGFHDWKSAWGSPAAAYAVGVTIWFTLWFIAIVGMVIFTVMHARQSNRDRLKADDVKLDMVEDEPVAPPKRPRLDRLCRVLDEFTIVGTSLRLLLILLPWPFFSAIFGTCWSCFDFEAATAHEVGHLLGLGHPDLVPHETISNFAATGVNSYHAGLASGVPLNNVSCLHPWADVRQGVPDGAAIDSFTSQRPSIMNAFTKHNPHACLEVDDLEALNVLYPDCQGGTLTPVCDKPALNLGWLRMLLFVGGPYLIVLLIAMFVHHLAARQLGRGLRLPEWVTFSPARMLKMRIARPAAAAEEPEL